MSNLPGVLGRITLGGNQAAAAPPPGDPPPVISGDDWFLPPVRKKIPPIRRSPEVAALHGIRRGRGSAAYNRLNWTWQGVNVEIAGVTYLGGRWNGPLSDQQITDITAAGYGARIYTAATFNDLPGNID